MKVNVKNVDTECIRSLLGLKPWDEHKAYAQTISQDVRKHLDFDLYRDSFTQLRNRQTGRTTKLCCEAIANVLNGKETTIIVSFECVKQHIEEKIDRYISQLGLIDFDYSKINYEFINTKVLVDNSVNCV